MIENPYKRLPPLERRPDGIPYRMTPVQRKQANALIRRECCNCEDGNCIALDDGDTCACPQIVSFSVCGGMFVPKSNRGKYCPDCAGRMKKIKAAERKRKQRQRCHALEPFKPA